MPLSKPELEKLRADLERAMERKHDYVEDTITMVSDAYYEEVKGLLDEVNEAIRDIDSNDTATVAAVRKNILDSTDANEAVWKRFDKRLDGIIEHIDDYYGRIGSAPKIDREVIETLKGVWPTGGEAGTGIAGDLYDLSQHHRRGLANAVTRNVLGGLPRRNMVNELEELTGRTRWQAKQLAHDSSMAFARTVNAKKAEEAGFEFFEYMGGIVSGTRPFCRKHLEQVYTREEIAELDNGQTGAGTAFIRGGGYNCLHDWGPVERDWFDDEGWKSVRASTGSGPVGNDDSDETDGRNKLKRTQTGELTDGVYRVSPQKAKRHAHDTAPANKSRFDEDVDAEEIALEAAQQADLENAWEGENNERATVDVGRIIGTDVYTGKSTRHITIYRKKSGVIHATPETPPDDAEDSDD